MRIVRIEAYQVDLPYAGGIYLLSGGQTFNSFDATVVRVVADDGAEGWGESVPFGSTYVAAHGRGVRAGLDEMAPGLIGLDARHPDRVQDRMDDLLTGHLHAKTPIDLACWDLFGKAVDMPVCDLLGGPIDQALPLISSIHAGEPADMRARVAEFRAKGYRGHSLKVGADEAAGGPALDAARIAEATADRAPGEYFLVDANGGLTVESALRLLQHLPAHADIVLEAPCATWRETLSLRRRTSVPIVLDELVQTEADVIRVIADDAADGIGLKLCKNGGLTTCRRQRDIAAAAGLTMSVQATVGSTITLAAILHLGQTVPRHLLRCILDTRDMVALATADLHAPVHDGGVQAPAAPGLGITPNRDVLGEPVSVWS